MGDKEEKIEYSAEELKEIDRILDILPKEPIVPVRPAVALKQEERRIPELEDKDRMDLEEEALPAGRPGEEEIEDITDIIEEVEEPSPAGAPEREYMPAREIGEIGEMPAEISEPVIEEPVEFEPVAEEEIVPEAGIEERPEAGIEERPEARRKEKLSPLDELETLTAMEPESVDLQEISGDRYVSEEKGPKADLGPVPRERAEETEEPTFPEAGPGDIGPERELEAEIPGLSEISPEKHEGIPGAKREDFRPVDLGMLSEMGDVKTIPLGEELPSGMEDMKGFDEPARKEAPVKKVPEMEDFGREEFKGMPDVGKIDEALKTETIPEYPEEEKEEIRRPSRGKEAPPREEGGIELSDRELRKLKTALMLFHPAVRKAIKDIIIGDLLPQKETQHLIDMILSGKPEENIHKLLEKKLKRTIEITERVKGPGRRVITARPEYTAEGLERQKRLLKITKIFGIAAGIAFLMTVLLYQYAYKPVMARKYIREGVALIREPGAPTTKKVKDYQKAEELFRSVDENYMKDYLPGYNAYARAYFEKKEYEYSLKKLEQALKIDSGNVETHNSMGYFYSKIPPAEYERIKPAGAKEKQLDMAIRHYRYSLNRDSKNITAMFGIGNAFLYQGEYLKARQYYENILAVDKDSVVGYSGLLNLYIERNDLPDVLSIHADLREKKILTEVPSALLAKLAWYYMGKKRTDRTNIRVDYGIQSSRLKDLSDNPYPAVRAVLEALQEKDINYPPLHVLYAKLSRELKNMELMKEHLKTALKKEPNYFAALHLMGEYHYYVKEPVEAYKYMNKAVKASASPPAFTEDDFYKETEELGKTYAIMGNIFYYFFDKVKYRFPDELEDEEIDQDKEKMANYEIARQKYELAEETGYKSSEVYYNLGRIYYMKDQFEKAMEQWLNLYEDFATSTELLFSLGNAFYHMNNMEASKGEYLKLISAYEYEADKLTTIFPNRKEHIRIFQSLSSAYNNLGAVFQMQNREAKSHISYWKAIDYAKRIEKENEFARVNLARSFKERKDRIMPILDENIPYSIDIYREDMR